MAATGSVDVECPLGCGETFAVPVEVAQRESVDGALSVGLGIPQEVVAAAWRSHVSATLHEEA